MFSITNRDRVACFVLTFNMCHFYHNIILFPKRIMRFYNIVFCNLITQWITRVPEIKWNRNILVLQSRIRADANTIIY